MQSMQILMVVCTIANVAQAIYYQRQSGKFQTTFWGLAALTALFAFVV